MGGTLTSYTTGGEKMVTGLIGEDGCEILMWDKTTRNIFKLNVNITAIGTTHLFTIDQIS
jgi:hypothetical protein